jgi:hypothetical protein
VKGLKREGAVIIWNSGKEVMKESRAVLEKV